MMTSCPHLSTSCFPTAQSLNVPRHHCPKKEAVTTSPDAPTSNCSWNIHKYLLLWIPSELLYSLSGWGLSLLNSEPQCKCPGEFCSFLKTHDYTWSLQWHTIKFAGDTTVLGLINTWNCLTSTEPQSSRELLPLRNFPIRCCLLEACQLMWNVRICVLPLFLTVVFLPPPPPPHTLLQFADCVKWARSICKDGRKSRSWWQIDLWIHPAGGNSFTSADRQLVLPPKC